MELRVRKMGVKDIDTVAEIERNSLPTPWSAQSFLDEVNNPLSLCLVGETGELIIAYICIGLILEEGHILTLGVRGDYRGRGIGKRLLTHTLRELSLLGSKKLFLEVRQSNITAMRLYGSLGFHKVGIRKDYYHSPREDALIMMRHVYRPE